MPKSDFPEAYLTALERNHREKVEASSDPAERLLMYSGARLNWVGEYINDASIRWRLEKVPVYSLTLTGTCPEWNAIILGRAEANPAKFRELLKRPDIKTMFQASQYTDIPILIRNEYGKLKILDGMNRTIAAIRDNIRGIRAYIGTREGVPVPIIEPHVIYDFIRAFHQREGNEEDFRGGLRFLLNSYTNVRKLLEARFNSRWVEDEKIQQIIKEVLGE
jgi:hypothetical protein